MWIRSQDELILLNLNCVAALGHFKWYGSFDEHGPCHGVVAYTNGKGDCYDFELGRYYSEKRVAEIIEEIEDDIIDDTCIIYYMPIE